MGSRGASSPRDRVARVPAVWCGTAESWRADCEHVDSYRTGRPTVRSSAVRPSRHRGGAGYTPRAAAEGQGPEAHGQWAAVGSCGCRLELRWRGLQLMIQIQRTAVNKLFGDRPMAVFAATSHATMTFSHHPSLEIDKHNRNRKQHFMTNVASPVIINSR